MSLPVVRTHTDAVIAALEGAGLTVGDAVAPDAAPPYAVVYSVSAGGWSGTLAEPYEDAALVFQVTCVGATREQAEWVADKAIATLLGGLSVSGRFIANVAIDLSGGVLRDDQRTPPLFYSTPRFRVLTTPA